MEYYIKINEEKRGPYSLNELAEKQHNKKQFSSHNQHLRRRVTLVVLSVF